MNRPTALKVTRVKPKGEPETFVWNDTMGRYLKLSERDIPKQLRTYIEEDDIEYYEEYHNYDIIKLY